jgi:hypothetical protein
MKDSIQRRAEFARGGVQHAREIARSIWQDSHEQISLAMHENRHADANRWRLVKDHALEAWLGAGLEAMCRHKLIAETMAEIGS